jgi:hypothetical protein
MLPSLLMRPLVIRDAWPLQLQQFLRAHHNFKDQVLNAGAIGWSISHEITRAKRDLPMFKPDYVIIYSGINEEANIEDSQLEGKNITDALDHGIVAFSGASLGLVRALRPMPS